MAFPLDLVTPSTVSDVSDTPAVNLDLLTATARPAFNPDGIPDSLKTLSQWTCWRYEDKGNGKPTKPPIDARTGRYASSKDPATWSTFDAALARFNADSTIAGLNIVLTAADPIALIDIDDYGDSPDPLAVLVLSWFTGTYAEKSPSGGLHIFAIGQCPGAGQKKNGIFEVRRTLTVTGDRIEGHTADLTEQQAGIDLYHRYCLCGEPLPDTGQAPDMSDMSDAEIEALEALIELDCLSSICPQCGAVAEWPDCEKCGYDLTQAQQPNPIPTLTEKNVQPPAAFSFVNVGSSVNWSRRLELALTNPTIAALYHGDIAAYGDRSGAELALCIRLLTFANGDTTVVADWLNGSQCGKWLERSSKESDVYRRNTLAAALNGWDGVCFEDKRQPDIDHGRLLAEALLRGQDKAGQAGHSDPDKAGQAGQTEMSGSEQANKKPLFMDAADLLLTLQPPHWLIKRFVSADSLTTLFGSPGCGKSFVAIDMACCIASGQEWNGNRTATGQVLYIAGEGHVGFARRLTAWQGVHGIIPPNRLFVSTRSIAFDPAGLQAVLDAIEELSDVPALIVIDTLATVIDGNENDAADMARFIRALKAMQVRTQAAVLVVHHTGHGDKSRARGHSSLNGAIDTELKLERTDGNGTLTCTKQKDGEEPQPVGYALTQAVIGIAEDGDAITSCTVDYCAAEVGGGAKRKPSTSQVIALRALHTALVDHGETYRGQFAVHIDHWRKAAYVGGIADTPDAKQKAFVRSRKELVASGDVKCNDDLYWFTDVGEQGSAAMLFAAKTKQADKE